jgi:hypothetical protein
VRVEEDRFDEDEAAVGEGGGYPNHVPKQAFFFNKCLCEKNEPGIMRLRESCYFF